MRSMKTETRSQNSSSRSDYTRDIQEKFLWSWVREADSVLSTIHFSTASVRLLYVEVQTEMA